ncbi:TIGR00341 family protein [Rubrivirga sp. S365]|uniref:TIGR00341 family protein n=1 Tax=Rubrivirga litoralis TaxID=3075598 RepID=A0ABU3BSI6_9BACT|nr:MULTISPECIES: TIGR00341 family protein [unclassified Rubrivirga]MDT0632260.1 TIGR00341 family protein [Rubrivirga sp. F394]MDT7856288.1 TIGR00341 family protein [Rubrivirga sp. S365]
MPDAPPADDRHPALDSPAPEADGTNDGTRIEEAAREKFGLRRWDCPALYRDTADAATDTDLPFWLVLLLSGAIATLGLGLNQTAVVIGAMLVAPLLGPLLGLSLALAVGDGRLALQTALTIIIGAASVVALAAVLVFVLPFQDVTPEIASRTRPTTLDLGIAVFSGLAGAVVTVSREKRLSASIPGVAIAVALIPPLGVAGFAIGTQRWDLLEGPLLLFGANLGGIVLSGMGAFLLVGMHRDDVLAAARDWHRNTSLPGLAGRIDRSPSLSSVRVFESTWARVGLVVAFIAVVSFPLTTSLMQFLRETRVERAVSAAAAQIQARGDASVLSRDVTLGVGTSDVRFRVATTGWIDEDERGGVERLISSGAGEPVTVRFEQLLASDGDLDAIASRFSTSLAPTESVVAPDPPSVTLQRLGGQVTDVLGDLALPDGVRPLGADVSVGAGPTRVVVTYAAARRLPPEAEAIVVRQAAAALELPPASVGVQSVVVGARPVPADSVGVMGLAGLAARFPSLRLTVTADSAGVEGLRRRFLQAGAPARQVLARPGAPGVRLSVAPPQS